MKPGVRAQLHSSSGRSSKILKDHTHIGTVVEVAGVGRLVLDVNSGGEKCERKSVLRRRSAWRGVYATFVRRVHP